MLSKEISFDLNFKRSQAPLKSTLPIIHPPSLLFQASLALVSLRSADWSDCIAVLCMLGRLAKTLTRVQPTLFFFFCCVLFFKVKCRSNPEVFKRAKKSCYQIRERGPKLGKKKKKVLKKEKEKKKKHPSKFLTWSAGALHHPLSKENGTRGPSSPFVSQSRHGTGLWTFGRATVPTADGASAN